MTFFKNFLAALLAVVVGFGLVCMMWTMALVGMIASLSSTQVVNVPKGSVLRLNPGIVTDAPASSVFEQFDFATFTPLSRTTLLGTIRAIETAATDERIEGIYINFDEHSAVPLAALEEIRTALVKFKESGKFIVAYQEYYGQIGYWVASVADRVYINPAGGVEWKGLAMELMFYKGLLDKLGIEPVVVRHGSFKSAVEPFILDKMSPENRLQYETFAGSMWDFIVGSVAGSRGIPAADLQRFADELTICLAADALDKGMVDGLRYEEEVINEMGEMIAQGWSREEAPAETAAEPMEMSAAESAETAEAATEYDVKVVSFGDYATQTAMAAKNVSHNKIAVIYAEGDIVSGTGEPGSIGSASMVKRLAEVRKDPNVKAVVFRVNSPGGSALASDVMWHELTLLKEKVPVIVSMGNYAASGGYYISCPADAIYADHTTLTGSIGVFGLFPNVGSALKNKLGVTTDVVNTAAHADMGSLFRTPSAVELAYFQAGVEDTYATFIGHVAQGRNMTAEAVDNIGQGRIWSGVNALEIGLVDNLGGIVDAIALAADRGGVADDFRVWEVTPAPVGLAAMFGGFSAKVRNYVLRDEMGEAFTHYENLREMLDEPGVQARMPYVLEIR